jgi:hypothetical protein
MLRRANHCGNAMAGNRGSRDVPSRSTSTSASRESFLPPQDVAKQSQSRLLNSITHDDVAITTLSSTIANHSDMSLSRPPGFCERMYG